MIFRIIDRFLLLTWPGWTVLIILLSGLDLRTTNEPPLPSFQRIRYVTWVKPEDHFVLPVITRRPNELIENETIQVLPECQVWWRSNPRQPTDTAIWKVQ